MLNYGILKAHRQFLLVSLATITYYNFLSFRSARPPAEALSKYRAKCIERASAGGRGSGSRSLTREGPRVKVEIWDVTYIVGKLRTR